MKKIAFMFIAAMAVLSFTGCKKKNDNAANIAKMEGFKNDMCKCKDKACADGVDKAMNDWSTANKPKDGKKVEMSKDEETKVAGVMKDYMDCRTKAAPPDMAPPAAPAGTEGAAPPAPAGGDTAAPPAGGAAPAAGGDMKGGDKKPDEPKK